MRLYIYFLDFLARISAFQRRIGWNRADYILLFLTICWTILLLLSSYHDHVIAILVVWLYRIYTKYLHNWRKAQDQE